jgi:type III secretion protein J
MSSERRVAIAAFLGLLLSACQVEIQHQLNEKEANDIVVLLEQNHISARKDKEEGGREITWKISVPNARAASSMILLRENELPQARTPGLEIFNRGSLISSATEEHAMLLQALSGELSRTLRSIDGVLDARVHINIPQSDDLADRAKPEPSASVFVKYQAFSEPGKKAPPLAVSEEQIRTLVARAIQDLQPKNVDVVLTAASPPGTAQAPVDVDVLGIRMAQDSVNTFRALLSAMALVIVALAGYIGYIQFSSARHAGRSPKVRVHPGS